MEGVQINGTVYMLSYSQALWQKVGFQAVTSKLGCTAASASCLRLRIFTEGEAEPFCGRAGRCFKRLRHGHRIAACYGPPKSMGTLLASGVAAWAAGRPLGKGGRAAESAGLGGFAGGVGARCSP